MKIPVKKSDGTTVFLTMEEFKEYKKNAATPATVPVTAPTPVVSPPVPPPVPVAPAPVLAAPEISKPKKLEQGKVETISLPDSVPVVPVVSVAPPVASLPIVADTHTELATTTPVTEIFFDEAKAKAPKIATSVTPLPPKADTRNESVVPAASGLSSTPVTVPPVSVIAPVSASGGNVVKQSVPDDSDKQPEWKTSDHASLLESDISKEKKSLPAPTPSPAADNATTILTKVKEQFPGPIPKDIEGRFDSLVLSRIRDVRSVIDFEQYAQETKEKGGLGFDEDQVGLLLALIAAAQKITAPASTVVKKLETSAAPVSGSSVNSGIRITPVMSSQPLKSSTPSQFPIPKEEYSFSPPAKPQNNKPLMQDVTPAVRKQTMGPVDEIQYFTLVDFRRLSPKTESAREILKGKFQSLQEESYVLFLDARDAWHESPLFHIYQETILKTLEDKKTLKDALAQKTDGLSQAELDAIVEINHYLG